MTSTLTVTSAHVNGGAIVSASHGGYSPSVASTVAQRIQKILDRTGWSQRELSRRSGLSPGAIGWILAHPDRPSELDTLKGIASAAKVSLAWLTSGTGAPDADDDSRGPSTVESEVPHFGNAVGWADARREAERTHPDVPAWAWDQAATMAPMHLRTVVTPEQVVSLARMALQLADPRAMTAAIEEQARRLAELEAQLAAKLAADKPATPEGKKGRGK